MKFKKEKNNFSFSLYYAPEKFEKTKVKKYI